MADDVCEGRVVFTLEGGYHLNGLSQGVVETLRAMVGMDNPVPYPSEKFEERDYRKVVEKVIEIQKTNWKL